MTGKTWFSQKFGFLEHDDYQLNCDSFDFDPTTNILISKPNGASFYVGPFEYPTLKELRGRLTNTQEEEEGEGTRRPKGLVYGEMVGDIQELHSREINAGAVIMVASQFNALEMVGRELHLRWA